MTRRMAVPWPVGAALAAFMTIAVAMIFFGARMTLHRVDMRALADPMMAIIVEVDSRVVTSTDSDGRTTSTTERKFVVEVDKWGERVRRTMVEANFEPEEGWFNGDEVDPDVHTMGARVPVLVRRDLNFAVTPAGFWTAYLVPAILMGFGTFVLAFLSLWWWLAFRR